MYKLGDEEQEELDDEWANLMEEANEEESEML